MSVYARRVCHNYPFPQADSHNRLVDLLTFLCESREKRDDNDIASYLEVHPRQARYYADALCFFGLARLSGGYRLPTKLGREIIDLPFLVTLERIAQLIFERSIFSEAAAYERNFGELPSVDLVTAWILNENPELNSTTSRRRAQTVLSWVGAFRKHVSATGCNNGALADRPLAIAA
jgi:hypothetical protein